MLDADEVSRRIKAARELRNMEQTALGELVAEDGLGKSDVGRLERGELPLTRVRRESLARHLRVPERWFTAESVDDVVGYEPPASVTDDLRWIREAIEEMRTETRGRYDALDRLLKQREDTERRLRHMTADEADEVVRMLAESRMRLGPSIGLRSSQAARAKDRQARSSGAGA